MSERHAPVPFPSRQPNRNRRFAVVRRRLPPLRIELNPILAGFLVLLGLALLGWSGATTSYALFRDEFLIQLVSRHTADERTSSAEISRLRDDLERVSSQLLIERENFATELESLSQRQADVEKRRDVMSQLGVTQPVENPAAELRLGDAQQPRSRTAQTGGTDTADLHGRYDVIERNQKQQIAAVQDLLDRRRTDLGKVYAQFGLKPAIATPVKAGMGGLYLPFGLGTAAAPDEMDQLRQTALETEHLRQGLDRVPVRSPLPAARPVSDFGNRVDPFTGGMAFHSGIDLEAAAGTPAFATASGTVTAAEWNGGYGLMVEIAHDHGYATRYAHLSRIAVKAGQEIHSGDVVGYVGSTGRSTGPHLHYETRRDDAALNPLKYLAAAETLAD